MNKRQLTKALLAAGQELQDDMDWTLADDYSVPETLGASDCKEYLRVMRKHFAPLLQGDET